MADVVVYTTEPCAFCARVKGLLDARGLQYREVSLAKDPQGRTELAQRTGMLTFPQVLVGERLVGGFAETYAAVQSGELDEFVSERST